MCLWEDTFNRYNRLCDGFNRPCMVLFSAVAVVVKQSNVKKTTASAGTMIAKSIRLVGRNMKLANNVITSW